MNLIEGAITKLRGCVRTGAQILPERTLSWPNNEPYGNNISTLFDESGKIENYEKEFDNIVADIQSSRLEEFYDLVPDNKAVFGGLSTESVRSLYAIIRAKNPDIVVETGVCNGVSTLGVLIAMEKNQNGVLYSIDYPTYSDSPAPEFQKQNYPNNHTFSAIPKGRSPGWIVPERFRERWNLRTGKSQRKLPELLIELDRIDVFIHDSDHSFPCMMFEYELAWEHLTENGLLLSDDIDTNEAFKIFAEKRAGSFGEVCSGFGFVIK